MGIPEKHNANPPRDARPFLLLSLLLLLLGGCGAPDGGAERPDAPVVENNSPVQESWRVEFLVTEEGRRKSLITAGHAAEYRIEGKSEQRLDGGVEVRFFNPEGNETTRISADRAVVYENQDIEGIGHVVISSRDSTVIRTEYARRSGADRKIRSDRFVRIDRPDQQISGYGFESDQELKHYRIFRGSGVGTLDQ